MKIEIELDNLTTEEQETIKRIANKIKKKQYWVPHHAGRYFYIDADGSIKCTNNNGNSKDTFRISVDNCFHTKEEAEEAIKRLQMQTKWKRLSLEAGEANNPWDGKHIHWTAYFENGALHYLYYTCMVCTTTHFPSKESLINAIAEIGEYNVKRYILGVTQ